MESEFEVWGYGITRERFNWAIKMVSEHKQREQEILEQEQRIKKKFQKNNKKIQNINVEFEK